MKLEILGDPLFSFNAQYFSKEDYDGRYLHTFDMKKRENIYLNIDYKQMGVGGDNSWGARPHTEYLLLPHEYNYSFTIKVFGKE